MAAPATAAAPFSIPRREIALGTGVLTDVMMAISLDWDQRDRKVVWTHSRCNAA
jgi:hypothetical protein